MKFLHLADIHGNREHWEEVCASLDVVEVTAEKEAVDLIAIAGDTADGPLQNSERDVMDGLCARLQGLANIAPVVILEGTPSHDAPGSLEIFERLRSKYGITILRPGKAYFLAEYRGEKFIFRKGELLPGGVVPQAKALLFGVPEPSKKWLLAGAGATGKDASDEEVRAAMRALFLGLGGMRKEHSDLPCVLLYHGQVSGARTGTGYTAGSGIAVSRDDLAAVGFDYGALGDIHLPQQIPDLPAYYPGKVYTGDWREVGYKPGCNLVEIKKTSMAIVRGEIESPVSASIRECLSRDEFEKRYPSNYYAGFSSTIARIDFPHAERVKFSIKTGDKVPWDPPAASIEGKLVWVEYSAAREETIDTERFYGSIMREGAIEGSQVTLNILPTETVRAAEITEKRSLREKVQVWGEASETPVPETVLAKADELEREGQAQGAAGQGAHIRIDRLVLRGAIGIWKKSRKDEIVLDLETEGSGVLAFASPNGAGKTTILENLHPWPCMLTRDGTLKDHFRLKDSFRELTFTDERTGWRYRSLINIRADIASGSAEYFLSVDKGAGFEPYAGINGRKEPYEAAIAQLFGSLEMYLRTAFVTQRPTKYAPDLSSATQGQRKTLFVELAGIDYLERYREAAKARGDALDGEIIRLDAIIAAAADVEDALRERKADLEAAIREERVAKDAMEASTARGQALAKELETVRGALDVLNRKAERLTACRGEIRSAEAARDLAADEITRYQAAAEGQGEAEMALAEVQALEIERDALMAQEAEVAAKNREAASAYQKAVQEIREKQDSARRIVNLRTMEASAAEKALAVAQAKAPAGAWTGTCQECGQVLPEGRIHEHERKVEDSKAEIARLQGTYSVALGSVKAAQDAFDAIIYPPTPESVDFPGAERLADIKESLLFKDRSRLEETIRAAREAGIRIDEAQKRKDAGTAKVQALETERVGLEADTAGMATIAAEVKRLDAARTEEAETYTSARSAIAAAQARATAAQKALEEADRRKAARDEAATKRDEKILERDDWRLLERAVGPNGIQALELDALAPSIAAVSNRLLSAAYGSRYQIEFRTTRIAGKGSKTKQVEDFEIYVLDAEDGSEQTIDSLSGGERVWIMKALTDGFAIIRARNTGTKFLTAFLDEADGALDPESRMLYLRMLEAAHVESGRYQTIIVTHSKELQAMVEKTINVADLGPREAKAEERAA